MAYHTFPWTRPAWSPDGTRIAYQRYGMMPGVPTEVSVVEVTTGCTTDVGTGLMPTWLDRDTLIISDFTPSPAVSGPSAVPLSRASFVDVRTGQARLLPRSIRSIPRATHFETSPDGRRLAFDDGLRIYVATLAGHDVRAVTPARDESAPSRSAIAPSWSPDGRSIAFSDGETGFVVNLATGKVRKVVSARRDVWRLDFSPDGRDILFTRLMGHGRWPMRLWVVPRTGGPARALPLRGAAFGSYSPDGTVIAYRKTAFDGDLTRMTADIVWLADADGPDSRPSTKGRVWMSQLDTEALWPAWSPDGTRIAYERLYCRGVFVIDLRTGRGTRIGDGINPSWVDRHTLIVEDDNERGCG